jgi:quercetin dioxygenase-like cupin family protein
MKSKYLIRMLNPEDWIRSSEEAGFVINEFTLPQGPFGKNQMSDTVYHDGAEVPYHEHSKGVETYFLAKGSVECFVRAKHFSMKAGDILHLPPYTGHGFRILEEGTILRGLFQEAGREEPILREPIRAWQDMDRTQMPNCRTPEFGWATYIFNGVTLRLKVGRWECNGVKEIWHASFEKNMTLECRDPCPDYSLYHITKGRIRFNVLGEDFEAGPDNLVLIPPEHPYSIETVENSEMYDNGCSAFLLSMLEDIATLKKTSPEDIENRDFLKNFMRRYGCFVTSFNKIG